MGYCVCYECEWEVKRKDPDSCRSEVKKGFNRARQESESECRQGSEYQTVKYREDPKTRVSKNTN